MTFPTAALGINNNEKNKIKMNMNKNFLTPALVLSLAALGFAGCTDDDMPGGGSLPEGTEFNFGAGVESSQTRTYYDPTDVANAEANAWGICWNRESDGALDHIYIYSPKALAGRNQASYTVTPADETKDNYSGSATKDGDTGVQVGSAPSYDFYAMYPASAVKAGSGTGTTLSATMPDYQTASTDEKMSATPVGTLQTKADMNCALMIAKETGYTPTAENQGQVSLQFEPFASMLDIIVNGTADDNTANNVRVTSVIIEANAPIAGDFKYDYSSGNFTFDEKTSSNSITIETMFADADNPGGKVGVMMGKDSQLRVRAFMIPNLAATEIKVKVVTSQSKTLTKTLQGTFKPRQIHFVKLPRIATDNLKLDYSIWLSQMDENIYISELSLPGSALSFNYVLSDEYMKTQTLNLTEQFNAGARVFQCHVHLVNQKSVIDGGDTSVGIAASDGSSAAKSDGTSYYTLGDVLNALQREMSGTHRDEFCVLTISDWIDGVNEQKVTDLYSRLNVVLKKAGEMGLVATGITPNTTIGDIKGKVIVKVQLNGGYTSAWSQLAGSNTWTNIYKETAETAPYYSPMLYGTLPATTAGGTSNSALTGDMNIIYSDCANPIDGRKNVGTIWNPQYQPTFKTGVKSNATNVLAAYNKNYENTDHKNFSMTYLGGCGYYYNAWGTTYTYYPYDVAQTLNKLWLDYSEKPTNKPWGWVMFNCVGTEETTATGIQAVIEHNASTGFKLLRRPAAKAAPSGDTKGTANGGPAF